MPQVGAVAVRLGAPAVRLDQLAHDREADSHAAVAAIEAAFALDEEIEDARQQIRRDTDTGVAHAQHRLVVAGLDFDGHQRRRAACT